MRSLEEVASDESANSESDLEVEDYDLEDESSEELEELDENKNLVVVQNEVRRSMIIISLFIHVAYVPIIY